MYCEKNIIRGKYINFSRLIVPSRYRMNTSIIKGTKVFMYVSRKYCSQLLYKCTSLELVSEDYAIIMHPVSNADQYRRKKYKSVKVCLS